MDEPMIEVWLDEVERERTWVPLEGGQIDRRVGHTQNGRDFCRDLLCPVFASALPRVFEKVAMPVVCLAPELLLRPHRFDARAPLGQDLSDRVGGRAHAPEHRGDEPPAQAPPLALCAPQKDKAPSLVAEGGGLIHPFYAHPPGVSMIGYVTVTIPFSGLGNDSP